MNWEQRTIKIYQNGSRWPSNNLHEEWWKYRILKQANKRIGNFKTLGLGKNRDSETPSYKKRDCETHITAKKTRLRDPWILTKILRDPEVLKDHIRHPCFSRFSVVYIIIFAGKSVITKDIIIFHYQDHHPITVFSVKRQLRKKKANNQRKYRCR